MDCFSDGLDIADDFKSRWDMILLDIQMKHLDGLATARRIRACDSEVVPIFRHLCILGGRKLASSIDVTRFFYP
ncbi:MAG: response regulator transcription factor [Clostridia bacterium]|nr:response regulator transcription factor [Clostridia bacterium]